MATDNVAVRGRGGERGMAPAEDLGFMIWSGKERGVAPEKDLEFLLGKLDEMKELDRLLGVEGRLQQFRSAVDSAKGSTNLDYKSAVELGLINEKADELLEKIWCWYERHRSSGTSSSLVVKVADVVTSFFNKIKFSKKNASELKELTSEYHQRTTAFRSVAAYSDEQATYPKLEAPDKIVGRRDEDVKNIITRIDQLRQRAEEDDHKLHIIPIVGMPGIGKTTVAHMVYTHPLAEDMFDQRIWVDVDQYFDHQRVLRCMANFLLGLDYFLAEEEVNIHILEEKLMGMRYLLVLDDVWNEDLREWNALQQQLQDISGAQGTVIVTTTRHGVAEMMMAADNSYPPYELQGLSEADCLQLFLQLFQEQEPFPQGEDKRIQIMVNIHRKYGLPLQFFSSLKGFMVDKNYPHEFISRCIVICWNSFSWRYERLPIRLRYCFRLCSLFPQDHDYDMEEFGDIWNSIRSPNYALIRDLFDREIRQYDELWNLCFFLNPTEGKVTYRMRYSMHQFAKHLNRGIFQMMIRGNMMKTRDLMLEPLDNPLDWLHLSLLVDSETSAFPKALSTLKNLKTLILLREPQMLRSNRKCKISRIAPQLFSRMKYLCVLDLQHTMIKKLPRTVGKLLNLRYLNLSGTDITALPRCIGKLQSLMFLKLVNCIYLRRLNDNVAGLVNLEKLDIAGCHSLVRVPDRIDNMRRLKCFNIKDCSSLTQMPYQLGIFDKLHTLPRYIVGDNDGYTIKELNDLWNLEGELRVENLQKVATGKDAAIAELSMKRLKSLTLQWNWWKHVDEEDVIEEVQVQEVLEKLRPNEDLIKLEIISYMGKQFPRWMREMPRYLASLKEIKLFNLKWCQALPPLGVLRHLMVVEISGMDVITNVDDAFYGPFGTFPSLQKLTFSQMPKLEKWLDVKRGNEFPRLTNLTFIHCRKMVAMDMELPSVTELTLWLNNERLYNTKGGLKGLAGSLKKLSISLCEQLLESSECEGLQELRSLEEIEISGCQELTNLPTGIRHLKSLKSLAIVCCNKMTSSPNWSNAELTSLCTLSINGCNLLPNNPPECS